MSAKRGSIRWALVWAAWVALPLVASAQDAEEQRYKLTGKQMRIDNVRNVVILTDSVRLEHGTATVTSERAEKQGSSGREHIFFYDNVRIFR